MNDQLLRGFPVYAARLLNIADKSRPSKQYLLISGGGGKSASGIQNKLELFDINNSRVPKLVYEVSTDELGRNYSNDKKDLERNNAPMDLAVYNDKFIAVGVGEKTQIYEVVSNKPQPQAANSSVGRIARKRNTNEATPSSNPTNSQNSNSTDPEIRIKRVAEVLDDSLDSDEAPVTRVALSSGSHLVSGGTNTSIKVFHYSRNDQNRGANQTSPAEGLGSLDVTFKYEILDSHNKELRDLAIHKNLIASISDDKNCFIWSLSSSSFKKLWSLKEQFLFYHKIDGKNAYKFKAISWFDTGMENVPVFLVTCHAPVLSRTTCPSYICLWRYNQNQDEVFTLKSSRSLYPEVGVSKVASQALFLDPKRRIAALGFESGHVVVYSLPDLSPIFRHEPADPRLAQCITSVVVSRKFVLTTSMDMCIRAYDFSNNYNEFWANNRSFLLLMLMVVVLVGVRVLMVGGGF